MKLEPGELDHAELREIALESEGPVLVVEYGLPDQGGTLLLYRFRIPSMPNEPATLRCSYLHDPPPLAAQQPSELKSSDLPPRVKTDALNWLGGHEAVAHELNRGELKRALANFRMVISC